MLEIEKTIELFKSFGLTYEITASQGYMCLRVMDGNRVCDWLFANDGEFVKVRMWEE
jgi:hypothetical protein